MFCIGILCCWYWCGMFSMFLLVLFYVLLWLCWNGWQVLLLDINVWCFDLFGWILWFGDVGVLIGLLVVLVVGLVLFIYFVGCIWCGYVCLQMLWCCVFDWIVCVMVWVLLVFVVCFVIQVVWGLLLLWIGMMFVGLFSLIEELVVVVLYVGWSGWEMFWVLFYVVVIWGNVGFLCEQVCCLLCLFVCLQLLLIDLYILCMLYDVCRGELCGMCLLGLGGVFGCGCGLFDLIIVQDYVFCVVYLLLVGLMFIFSVDCLGDCIDCVVCVSVCLM